MKSVRRGQARLEQGYMGNARVLLADDHSEIRERIADILEHRFDIVASVENGQKALSASLMLKPDILITDISMPILDGIQLASQLRELGYSTKIIFLTVHDDADYVEAAFSTGALGYVLKSNVATDLMPAIHEALKGRRFTSELMHNRYTRRDTH